VRSGVIISGRDGTRPPKFSPLPKPVNTIVEGNRITKQHILATYKVAAATTVTDKKIHAWIRIPSSRFMVTLQLVDESANTAHQFDSNVGYGSTTPSWTIYSAKENPDTGKINRLSEVYSRSASHDGFEYQGDSEILEVEYNGNSADFNADWMAATGVIVTLFLRVSWERTEEFCNDAELCRLYSRCEMWGEFYAIPVPLS
jgi:hypothetical protein